MCYYAGVSWWRCGAVERSVEWRDETVAGSLWILNVFFLSILHKFSRWKFDFDLYIYILFAIHINTHTRGRGPHIAYDIFSYKLTYYILVYILYAYLCNIYTYVCVHYVYNTYTRLSSAPTVYALFSRAPTRIREKKKWKKNHSQRPSSVSLLYRNQQHSSYHSRSHVCYYDMYIIIYDTMWVQSFV